MAEKSATPDVRDLMGHDLPQGSFPAGRAEAFRVHFSPTVHEHMLRHAQEDTSVEICGVLVGRWEQDEDGPFVAVTDLIQCDAAVSKSGEVTFTHDAWAEINRQMDTRFAELRIVGWYHSHPGFGIFLSARDRFIHEHFFSNPGQIACVVDPVRGAEGIFVWRDGEPRPAAHYWVGDRLFPEAAGGQESPQSAEGAPSRAGAAETSPAPTSSGWPLVRGAVLYVAVFLVGYLLAALPSSWQRDRIIEGTVAHYGVWKGLRPGLKEYLDNAEERLSDVAAAVAPLAADHLELVGEDAAASKKAEWDKVQNELHRTRRLLEAIETVYCLSPEESAAAAEVVAAKLAELSGGKPGAAAGAPTDAPSEKKSEEQAKPRSEKSKQTNDKPKSDGAEAEKPDASDPEG